MSIFLAIYRIRGRRVTHSLLKTPDKILTAKQERDNLIWELLSLRNEFQEVLWYEDWVM